MLNKTNTSRFYSVQKDLRTLTLMTNNLRTYIGEDADYAYKSMFMSGLPAVTIGGILLRLRRLYALRNNLDKSNQGVLDAVLSQHNNVYQNCEEQYEAKLLDEAHSRLQRISQSIDEYHNEASRIFVAFEPEQMRRTLVQEILYRMRQIGLRDVTLNANLSKIDSRLRRIVDPSEFQWHPQLKPVYPQRDFWYLYSELK